MRGFRRDELDKERCKVEGNHSRRNARASTGCGKCLMAVERATRRRLVEVKRMGCEHPPSLPTKIRTLSSLGRQYFALDSPGWERTVSKKLHAHHTYGNSFHSTAVEPTGGIVHDELDRPTGLPAGFTRTTFGPRRVKSMYDGWGMKVNER